MKLISFNIWQGIAGHKNLLGFFEKHKEVDVFCLQEVWHNGPQEKIVRGIDMSPRLRNAFTEISARLPEHVGYFRPHYEDWFGLAIFVKKKYLLLAEGDIFVHKQKEFIPEGDVGNHARNIQYVMLQTDTGIRTVVNFHGLWNGRGKTDSEDRLKQSDRIVEFLKSLNNPFVLCGDFNLLPDTESLRKLENLGLRNLIKEYGITSTRTSFYNKPEKFADYALVSDGIEVKDFKALSDEVSDHTPLYLEFE